MMNEKDNFETEQNQNQNGYHMNYQNTHFMPQSSHVSDPYWNSVSGWNPNPLDPFQKPVRFLPPSLSDIQADSGFIERAAKYSCFNGGNVSAILGTFSNSDPMSRNGNKEHLIESRINRDLEKNENGEGESSGVEREEILNVANYKKRKSPNLGNEIQAEGITRENNKEEKHIGENGKKSENANNNNNNNSDNNKEDYIHVRARRGQATTSHSLAERLRREKISERMKYLQDLVPGCDKVTGKAVMLDEIINYVQSLQRQVEFLSMKLSAVNPRFDSNIDNILSKNLFNPNVGPSFMGFLAAPNMVQPQLHPSQQNMMSNGWNGELHNLMQMAYPPLNAQELNR
ncbi:hypothetical protein LUZ60_000133 [Juncus effusus]|nr:hypothetical protein LUZ60_000133 [Juncus effusus]